MHVFFNVSQSVFSLAALGIIYAENQRIERLIELYAGTQEDRQLMIMAQVSIVCRAIWPWFHVSSEPWLSFNVQSLLENRDAPCLTMSSWTCCWPQVAKSSVELQILRRRKRFSNCPAQLKVWRRRGAVLSK